MREWPKTNDALGTVNRGQAAESGLCTLCEASCTGKCEAWLASLRGRHLLYPRNFGHVTAGSLNTSPVGIAYNSLRIQGRLYGSHGLPQGLSNAADDCVFPNVSVQTQFGQEVRTCAKVPVLTGALGSTKIAANYWNAFAIGAALSGFPIVVGENVVGVDRESVLKGGKIESAPELERRVEVYNRYFDGSGGIFVQMNIEDTRNGVAEYLIDKFGDDVILEVKWGQGAKDIGGEIQVRDLNYARFLKERGYVVDPDPNLPEVQRAFTNGSIAAFARHSRLGFTDNTDPATVRKHFAEEIARLRRLGFKRISLKTGAYDMEALALSIKLASENRLDLLTIDGAGGGTGMSPWNMMDQWGVPNILLHAKAYEYAEALAQQGEDVVDMAFGGGLAREDHIFKALAIGAPYTKMVCMGRALMIPGFVGSNIEGVLHPERKATVNGNWDKLPKGVRELGESPEQIFANYYELENRLGKDEMQHVPYGAIAVYTLADKLAAGLQQLMAGARKFNLGQIDRADLASANRETEHETSIPFINDALNDKALDLIKST